MSDSETRRPLVVANWKMHHSVRETEQFLETFLPAIAAVDDVDVAVAPPFTALQAAGKALAGNAVALAAQNVHWEAKGAFTGEIAAGMLLELGCQYAIVGHSERRQHFAETDATVRLRVAAALGAGLVPILCVGETLEQREAGDTQRVVGEQVRAALAEVAVGRPEQIALAYEPVWAIGTGRTATPETANEVHAAIRALLAEQSDAATAARIRILYGGSVKADNVDDLMAASDIDGALVGGASLDPRAFARIVDHRR